MLCAVFFMFSEAYAKQYGNPVSKGPLTSLESLEKHAGAVVRVQGRVRSVCSQKGCWMEIAPSMDRKTKGFRVTFKNYGFFVPTNSLGMDAKVEGTVVAENATFNIVATGVELEPHQNP